MKLHEALQIRADAQGCAVWELSNTCDFLRVFGGAFGVEAYEYCQFAGPSGLVLMHDKSSHQMQVHWKSGDRTRFYFIQHPCTTSGDVGPCLQEALQGLCGLPPDVQPYDESGVEADLSSLDAFQREWWEQSQAQRHEKEGHWVATSPIGTFRAHSSREVKKAYREELEFNLPEVTRKLRKMLEAWQLNYNDSEEADAL